MRLFPKKSRTFAKRMGFFMKENLLLSLGFGDIQHLLDGMNDKYKFVEKEFGFVHSYAGVKDIARKMLIVGQPYRLLEGRFLFIRRGNARINLNLREYRLEAPMVVLFSPGTVGEVKDFSPDYDFAMFTFCNSFMENFRLEGLLKSYSQRQLCLCIPLQENEGKRMETLCNLFWDILHDHPYPQDMIKEMILLIFKQLDIYRQEYTAIERQPQSRQEEVLNRFIDLVNKYAITERKISFYADKLCLTPHYLSAIIREASHQTVMDWINRAVIQEARILLRHSNLQISQIAYQLNFPNTSFFCKYFRRLTGTSPGEYQKTAG